MHRAVQQIPKQRTYTRSFNIRYR